MDDPNWWSFIISIASQNGSFKLRTKVRKLGAKRSTFRSFSIPRQMGCFPVSSFTMLSYNFTYRDAWQHQSGKNCVTWWGIAVVAMKRWRVAGVKWAWSCRADKQGSCLKVTAYTRCSDHGDSGIEAIKQSATIGQCGTSDTPSLSRWRTSNVRRQVDLHTHRFHRP